MSPATRRFTRPARSLAGRLRVLAGRVSLRGRLVLAATVAIAVVVATVTWLAFLAVRHELTFDVDQRLRRQAAALQRFADGEPFPPGPPLPPPRDRPVPSGGYVQVVTADGRIHRPDDQDLSLPVSAATLAVAAGRRDGFFDDVQVDGVHTRMFTAPLPNAAAVQVAVPVRDIDAELRRLEVAFLAVGLAGVGVAALLHRLMTRTVLAPVARLTRAAERIATTNDLTHRIEADRGDELGRLAQSFNAMLDALRQAVDAQRQLVADASHELRTPLTSLRTNVEMLARGQALPDADRNRLLHRIVTGLEEMTGLVSDIVELARGEEPARFAEEFRLDALVRAAVARAERHWPDIRFSTDVAPVLARGVTTRVERAVVNLLDNAAKFSPPREFVEVRLRPSGLVVRDHGPGIPPEDLPHVFDRFYRAGSARGRPGSGLGLAIVQQVADSHRGWVRLANADGGGAVARLWLPGLMPLPAELTGGPAEQR